MMNLQKILYTIMDVLAMIGLAFNVDWDSEYEDDDYVKAMRGE